jgi:hypothetical protein
LITTAAVKSELICDIKESFSGVVVITPVHNKRCQHWPTLTMLVLSDFAQKSRDFFAILIVRHR